MRVLILGGGGREHALAWAVAKSPRLSALYCAPGNAGTAQVGENRSVDLADLDAVAALARDHAIDLTIVGPEAPLCAGVVDRFESQGMRIFGPTAAAARIEGDKAYSKKLMKAANVPTAEGRVFTRFQDAREYVATRETGLVVKAAGLAAGKGVFVCDDPADALLALEKTMVDGALGDAGRSVVVEERLKGEELSVFALVDGRTIFVLETAQDHKRAFDGDAGPNTGGMGAYSPAPIADEGLMAVIERDVLVPIVDALRQDDAPYRGLLYAGLMITPGGPKALEFNCRFGDPEAQTIIPRLDSDLLELLDAAAGGRLEQADVRWNPKPAVTVVLASGGYPGPYRKGKVIEGLDAVARLDDVHVFHAGTEQVDRRTMTTGGRVLAVTALGADIADARDRAYQAAGMIRFEGSFFRRDIAHRAIAGDAVTGAASR
jgi:phosphoribosylamine--glycine ligase